jgi:hypothetical protein
MTGAQAATAQRLTNVAAGLSTLPPVQSQAFFSFSEGAKSSQGADRSGVVTGSERSILPKPHLWFLGRK